MARFDRQPEEEQEEFASKMCNMPDCPMVGTISDNTRGAGPWWCAYHFNQRSSFDFVPEEKRELLKISRAYNSGKRDYGAGILESSDEHRQRLLADRQLAKTKVR